MHSAVSEIFLLHDAEYSTSQNASICKLGVCFPLRYSSDVKGELRLLLHAVPGRMGRRQHDAYGARRPQNLRWSGWSSCWIYAYQASHCAIARIWQSHIFEV
jgi:hypothetical protein